MSPALAEGCDWIFFDCFNTLIDDFDLAGEEHGLCSLPDFVVAAGLFPTPAAFVAVYLAYRRPTDPPGGEIALPERLHRTLMAAPVRPDERQRHALVTRMLELWREEYHALLRPTPGVGPMLAHWTRLKPAGVISNFFLPDEPGRYLARFGFDHHFRFVVDSARFGFKKPHPSIFDAALTLAGLGRADTHRVLYIGDRVDLDVETPLALGFRVIHFHRGRSRASAAPTPPGVASINDWDEFR